MKILCPRDVLATSLNVTWIESGVTHGDVDVVVEVTVVWVLVGLIECEVVLEMLVRSEGHLVLVAVP